MEEMTMYGRADDAMATYWEARKNPSLGSITTEGDKGMVRAPECKVCGAPRRGACFMDLDAVGWHCAKCGNPWPVSIEETVKGEVQDKKAPKLTAETGVHRSLEVSLQFTRLCRKHSVGEVRAYIAACYDFSVEDMREAPELFPGVDLESEEKAKDAIQSVRNSWVECLAEIGRIRYSI